MALRPGPHGPPWAPHLVGDDLPHRVHHGVVVHIQRQGQRRGDYGPGAEVGTRFEEGQTWWQNVAKCGLVKPKKDRQWVKIG